MALKALNSMSIIPPATHTLNQGNKGAELESPPQPQTLTPPPFWTPPAIPKDLFYHYLLYYYKEG